MCGVIYRPRSEVPEKTLTEQWKSLSWSDTTNDVFDYHVSDFQDRMRNVFRTVVDPSAS
jgi:hypothetical protein